VTEIYGTKLVQVHVLTWRRKVPCFLTTLQHYTQNIKNNQYN